MFPNGNTGRIAVKKWRKRQINKIRGDRKTKGGKAILKRCVLSLDRKICIGIKEKLVEMFSELQKQNSLYISVGVVGLKLIRFGGGDYYTRDAFATIINIISVCLYGLLAYIFVPFHIVTFE